VSARFVPDPLRPRRRPTFEVRVGEVGVGGSSPLRVQSMTTTDTLDVRATADQAERLAAAGCEIVRITAPGRNEAEALREIAAELRRRGVRAPLVADIHFAPAAALIAAEHVEKVRINPGNYADKKRFAVREYSDAEYAEELERVAERFRPLVRRCRELGRALRIGTNHGSLSDRILNRYGDTPLGMVESALEFLDVCEAEGFRDVIFSMKASNAQVAIHAYRLLAARLAARAGAAGPRSEPKANEGRAAARRAAQAQVGAGSFDAPSHPFHLGVTEAGDGEDGRIKSAIGIGALLEDGIGDTIRVSLTEDPVKEIPVARALARRYDALWAAPATPAASLAEAESWAWTSDPYAHARRATRELALGPLELGGAHPVRVEIDLGPAPRDPHAAAGELARALAAQRDVTLEGVGVGAGDADGLLRAAAFASALSRAGVPAPLCLRIPPGLAGEAGGRGASRLAVPVLSSDDERELAATAAEANAAGLALEWMLVGDEPEALVARATAAGAERALFSVAARRPVHAVRRLAAALAVSAAADAPIVLRRAGETALGPEAALLHAATDLGAPLCDGIGDVVVLSGFGDAGRATALAYRILQGARLRTSWTEFISCPSCGRTLFDLEETTARIKARTSHLSGVKIAIMGCIVNGPGEMADADFGYVGSGPARVNLYVGKELVERNVPADEADDRLVELIRKHGRWVEA
jgi:(E)-4-hydroxy-3-methylbut-2-enyl-diphosphate synthase